MEEKEQTYRFGRNPRTFSPLVPHLSAFTGGMTLPPPPDSVDYTKGMPDDFGMMLNDRLNTCTCAAYYHARQVWTFQTQGSELTEPDQPNIERLYIETCGYNPNLPPPGPGGTVQPFLTYLCQYGAPIGASGMQRDKLLGFIEVDSRNVEDVKRVIYDCGVAYVGFNVPQNVTRETRRWDYDPKIPWTNDGHVVILAAYDKEGATAISWGRRCAMTWSFVVSPLVNEVYALVDSAWIQNGGRTPIGMTVDQLECQMDAIKRMDLSMSCAFQSSRYQAHMPQSPAPKGKRRQVRIAKARS